MVPWRPQPCYRVGRKKKVTNHRVRGTADGIEVWWVKWSEGRGQGHLPFHCLCLPTAPPLAGGTPASGTGGLLVSVQGVSKGMWECPFHSGHRQVFIAFKMFLCIVNLYIEHLGVLDTPRAHCVC